MAQKLKIDFVSDIACPWCVIGLGGLKQALENVRGEVEAEIHFQPFELNPQMGAAGQNLIEHVAEKYGSSREQSLANRKMIRDRAAEVGFDFTLSEESRIYNTFDAHRLLYWAWGEGLQLPLKQALFSANFTAGADVSDSEVLVAAAASVGLDADQARDVLTSGRYSDEVRAEEQLWLSRGINSVPAVVINEKWLISGGQPAEAFENALRNIAAEVSAG